MRHLISYTIILLFSFLFSTSFLYKNTTKNNQNIINLDDSIKIKKDTAVNKLPQGYPFIINYTLSKLSKIKSICTDSTGIMVFADNTGITFFDGETEKRLKIEDSPNEIKKDKKLNIFYIACKKGYGYLSKDKTGNYLYHPLSKQGYDNQIYNHVFVTNKNILFSGNYKVSKYNSETKKITEIYNDTKNRISGIFMLNGKTYINIENQGLLKVSDKTKKFILTDSLFTSSDILFSVPYKKNVILGLSDNQIYLFNGTKYSQFKNKASDYIKESIINGGEEINNKEFVITTLNGGAVILDKTSGKTVNILNYRTGLPDDEIFVANVDYAGGLWLAHDYGISRVAFDIPVKNYNQFPGLQGIINDVKFYDNTLYVAAGEGLYRLSEIKSYEEVKVAENKRIKYRKKISSNHYNTVLNNNENDESNLVSDEQNEKNNGFFQRWKNRRNRKKKEISSDEIKNQESINITDKNKKKISYKTEYKTITEYKKIYELHSIKYIYKKVKGINSKCKKITNYNKGILISTNSGLFFMKNNILSVIIPNVYIYSVSCNPNSNTFYVSTSNGLYKINPENNHFYTQLISGNILKETVLSSIFTVSDSVIWATGNHKIYLFKILGSDILSTEQFNINTDYDNNITITKKGKDYIFLAGSKAYYYNKKFNNISENSELTSFLEESDRLFLLNDTTFIINSGNRIIYKNNISDSVSQLKYIQIFNQVKKIIIDNNNDIWLISGYNEIFKINHNFISNKNKFKLYLINIKDYNGNSFINTSYLKLNSNYKNITVHLSAPGYLKKGFVNYFYGIDALSDKEFLKTGNPFFSIPELTPGKHLLSVYAVNSLNEKTNTVKIIIQVNPSIWQTTWFILAVFISFLILISLAISVFFRKKQRRIKEYNEILEQKVKERTTEIKKQNKLIQEQNSEIYEQYKKIEYQNNEIAGSIRYAGKIQNAAMSEIEIYTKYLSEFFIFLKPRDIVSGDFYWISEVNNKLLIAAVDCTGHGVPGGFLSMLGISFLNEIVKEISKTYKTISAADILNELRKKIITTLSTHGEEQRKEGMDMSLVVIDKENLQLNFAGAYNPAYIIRNAEIAKIEADRMPVGNNKKLNDIPFKNKYIKLKPDDCIYLFSDGYADQFGGKNQKKFNSRRLREMLLHIHKLSMTEQKIAAEKILQKWQGNNKQIDDILLIGIKI